MAKMRVKLILTRMNLNKPVYTQCISENNSNADLKLTVCIGKSIALSRKYTVLAQKGINLIFKFL